MATQDLIIQKYGEPSQEYMSKYCSMWEVQKEFPWFPAKRMFVNNDFKNKLRIAFHNIEEASLQSEIKTFDGCYVERKVRGSNKISLHSWAMAIDLNAHIEQLGQATTHFSQAFIAIMIAAGLFWGGNYKGRKDPMHFSLYNG
jgi:hypothetical protein